MKTQSRDKRLSGNLLDAADPLHPLDGNDPPLVAIVGPTAVGKTALSLYLAQALDGEIVSADSRQVYRGMDIGTAKATAREQAQVRHHLLDLLDPGEVLSLAQYQAMAYMAIDDILARGRLPFLVGGTGQYVMAVLEGWQVPRVPPDEALRRKLYRQAEKEGAASLHARLQALDPVAAGRIDARNVRRVVRALEVCLITGEPISQQQGKSPPPYRELLVGLNLPRPELYRRIDERVERMISAGLDSEVRALVADGYDFDLPAMSGVGYGQFAAYLAGEATLDEVVAEIKRATRRFVRHQANWFRQDDSRIHWFEARSDAYPAVLDLVRDFVVLARPD
jgi:tRNA dimethylallyltransferase